MSRKRKRYFEPPTNLAGYDPTQDTAGYVWSQEEANRIVDFFEQCCVLTSGKCAGQKFKLQKWQADYFATLNGWRDRSGKSRRYRESLLAVPRKNGKSESGAGLALFMLCADREARAQVYSAAKDRNQASLVFEPASVMARRSPLLQSRLQVTLSRKRIEHPASSSYYQALASDAGAVHGTNPHAVLFDELHTQSTRELYDVLKSGTGARQHPLFVSMTTAGYNRDSICYEVWQHARRVRDGVVSDPTFLPMIYEMPVNADWQDESVWRKVNPNLDVTMSMQFLRDEHRRAKETPAYENTFRNLYLNQWTQQSVLWLPMDAWDAGKQPLPNLEGEACWAGLDLSTTTDITAFVMVFPVDNGRFVIVPHFWIPEDSARKRERMDRVPYQYWAQQGFVTMTPGNVVDYDHVRADIRRLAEQYHIMEIAADRWNATQIITQLTADGMNVVPFGQGFASMSAPSKEFEKVVIGKQIVHGGNPVLRWMASNVSVATDAAGNIKPTKEVATGRIDGIVAAIMAIGRAASHGVTQQWFNESHPLEIG